MLRRVFEDSGHYRDGLAINKQVVKSLVQLHQTEDSLWAELKGVAYLEILSGDHSAAREVLGSILARTESKQVDLRLLRAYAHRYVGISYFRDPASEDFERARLSLVEARNEVEAIRDTRPTEHARFVAKLDRNFANLDLAVGKYEEAIPRLERSRTVFEELADSEHRGISALALAKAFIARARALDEPIDVRPVSALMGQAERSATLIGWPEGVGNVQEARADMLLLRASLAKGAKSKRGFLDAALDSARAAQASFQVTDARHRVASVESLIDRIEGQRQKLSMRAS